MPKIDHDQLADQYWRESNTLAAEQEYWRDSGAMSPRTAKAVLAKRFDSGCGGDPGRDSPYQGESVASYSYYYEDLQPVPSPRVSFALSSPRPADGKL